MIIAMGIIVSIVAVSILILGLQRSRKNSRRSTINDPSYNPADVTGGESNSSLTSTSIPEASCRQASIETDNIVDVGDSRVSIESSLNRLEGRRIDTKVETYRARRREGLRMIRGIGEKREWKLMSIGIRTIEELAEADPKDLASKLGVSEKLTSTWVEEAKLIISRKNM